MLDLFGQEVPPKHTAKAVFSDVEIDGIFDNILNEGELLKDLAANLKKLRRLKDKAQITAARKTAWIDLVWVFGLDEPSNVPFEVACCVCGANDENIRAAISREFANEIRMMHGVITARLPHLHEKWTRHLGRYVCLGVH